MGDAEAAAPPAVKSPVKSPVGAAYKVVAFRRLEERLDEYSALPNAEDPGPTPIPKMANAEPGAASV